MLSGSLRPSAATISSGCDNTCLANVPSTQYPATTQPFLGSVHHLIKEIHRLEDQKSETLTMLILLLLNSQFIA
jgi:hypothetical protein